MERVSKKIFKREMRTIVKGMAGIDSMSVKPAGSCECVGYRVERIAGA